MTTKKPWESKTLVLNAIAGLAAAVALFIPAAAGMGQYLADHAAQIAMGWSTLNVILRTVTKDRIVLGE